MQYYTSFVRPDFERAKRKGVPEVIFAEGKTVEQSCEIARLFLERKGRAILSRVSPELEERLRALAGVWSDEGDGEVVFEWHAAARVAVLRGPGGKVLRTGGRVGILSAGTSDLPAAQEAAVVCQEMGCEVMTSLDVGVAGLHRLFEPLSRMLDARPDGFEVDALIVAAGMDGALPSVVSGLADVPVIGLPTAVGYGLGGQGLAALYSMLQTCAPGMAVVNIGNGVGAGAMAGVIANRAALARRGAGLRVPADEGAPVDGGGEHFVHECAPVDGDGERSTDECAPVDGGGEHFIHECAPVDGGGEHFIHECAPVDGDGERSTDECAPVDGDGERSTDECAPVDGGGEHFIHECAPVDGDGERSFHRDEEAGNA